MAEVDYDKLVEPTEAEVESEQPTENPVEEPQEQQAEAESTEEITEEESKGGRANERIRQLVDEKNQLADRVSALEKLNGEIEKLRESLTKQPEPEPEVDFLDDPRGYVDQNRRALEARIAELESRDEEGSQTTQQELQALKFQMTVSEDERQFTTEHPDYLKALDYNRQVRREELELMGVSGKDADQVIGQEELFLAGRNLQGGKSAAEAAYNLALKRGYKPQVVDTEKVDEELDEQVARRERAREAQSMGGSGSPDAAPENTNEEWGPVIEAYAEVYGERAAREAFGDLMN
jgi:hypothetical protein